MKTRHDVSAGGVVYRQQDGGVEVCLIHPAGQDTWQLPKGLVDHGEKVEETAAREVREETGLEVEPAAPLAAIEYWYTADGASGRPLHKGDVPEGEPVRIHKRVHFFLFRHRGGSLDAHDHEVEEARWVPLGDARRMLSFSNERTVLAKAAEALTAPPR